MDQIAVYYINLDDRQDRRENIEDTLKTCGIEHFEKCSAVDTRRCSSKRLEDRFPSGTFVEGALCAIQRGYRQEHGELTSGSVGLYLSMYQTLRKFLETGKPYCLIFEDDAMLADGMKASDFQNVIHDVITKKQRFDLLLLSHLFQSSSSQISQRYVFADVKRFMMLSAYIVTKEGAQKIIDAALPMHVQLDWCISDLAEKNGIQIKAILPALFVQKPFFDPEGQWDSMQMDQPYQQHSSR